MSYSFEKKREKNAEKSVKNSCDNRSKKSFGKSVKSSFVREIRLKKSVKNYLTFVFQSPPKRV